MKEKLQKIGSRTTCPAAIFIRDKKVLLGYRHYGSETWKNTSVWTCPGGRCDEGESIELALRREVFEETNIKDFKILKFIADVPGAKSGDVVPVFLCTTNQEAVLMEPNKFSAWEWFGFRDFPKDFINIQIQKIILDLLS